MTASEYMIGRSVVDVDGLKEVREEARNLTLKQGQLSKGKQVER